MCNSNFWILNQPKISGQWFEKVQGVFFYWSDQISVLKRKKKNVFQPTRIFCTSKISWNRISDWLPIVFHFGTENWEEQLKKHPV